VNTIPLIDVSAALGADGPGKDRLVELFRDTYSEIGFAYVTGHGIDPALVKAVFAASIGFHALPDPQKSAIKVDKNHRGYIAINTSTDVNSKLAEVKKPNQSASFMMMREDAVADPQVYLSGPNQWPKMSGFRQALEAYNAAMSCLASHLMAIAARAAGGDPADVMPAFSQPTTWLRLLHYPPVPQDSPDDLYGSAPHTDFGCLTLLAQDPVGGLQVMAANGDWLDAPYCEGTFVLNVGDILHRLSNGRLRATPHRVVNRSGRERYSVPFFYDPHVSAVISPLPGAGEPQFEPIQFGEFLRAELEAGYDAHKPKPASGA
jgi:isopenicillin N synthase-like dioxygenase